MRVHIRNVVKRKWWISASTLMRCTLHSTTIPIWNRRRGVTDKCSWRELNPPSSFENTGYYYDKTIHSRFQGLACRRSICQCLGIKKASQSVGMNLCGLSLRLARRAAGPLSSCPSSCTLSQREGGLGAAMSDAFSVQVRTATKKAGGTIKNGRDSPGQVRQNIL